jgi:hypothetical protein
MRPSSTRPATIRLASTLSGPRCAWFGSSTGATARRCLRLQVKLNTDHSHDGSEGLAALGRASGIARGKGLKPQIHIRAVHNALVPAQVPMHPQGQWKGRRSSTRAPADSLSHD